MRLREKRVEVYFTEAGYLNLKEQAVKAGLSMSELIRRLVAGCNIKPKPTEPQREFLKRLTSMAWSVNQMAFVVNSTRQVSGDEVRTLLAMYKEILEMVKTLQE